MSVQTPPVARVAIVGFGEVGPILARAFVAKGVRVSAFDIKLRDDATRALIVERARASDTGVADDLASALADATLVFSAVTASQAEAVARAAAGYLRAGQTFIDLNSVSPAVKQRNSVVVQASGAHYLEAAVMAPVPPQGIQVPVLLGGPSAAEMSAVLNALGMRTQAVADQVGLASAIKLCRSIMIKGMEALCVQSMLAANAFGVDARVLGSLAASFPGVGWDSGYEAYLIGRVVEHGQRRSEEMREASLMLGELGMSTDLATAIADVQARLARVGREHLDALDEAGRLPNWRDRLDAKDI